LKISKNFFKKKGDQPLIMHGGRLTMHGEALIMHGRRLTMHAEGLTMHGERLSVHD
jgi:hypothetical protein